MRSCLRTRELFSPYLKEILEPEDRIAVEAHLSTCEDCSRRISAFRAELARLRVLGLGDLRHIRHSLEQELSPERRRQRLIVGLAALALGLLGLGLAAKVALDERPPSRRAARSPKQSQAETKAHDSPLRIPPQKQSELHKSRPSVSRPVLSPKPRLNPEKLAAQVFTPAPRAAGIPRPGPTPSPELARPRAPKATRNSSPEAGQVQQQQPAESQPAKPADAPPKKTGKAKPLKPPAPATAPSKPAPLPRALRHAIGRLSVENGLRYGRITLYPVVDRTAADRSDRPPAGRLGQHLVQEHSPPHPGRLLASPRSRKWATFLPAGLIVDGPAGLRISRTPRLLHPGIATKLTAVSVLDPDHQRALASRPQPKPLAVFFTAPSLVRWALLSSQDNARLRCALWLATFEPGERARDELQAGTAPTDTVLADLLHRRLRTRLRNLESDARDLVRRIRALMRSRPGLRGFALSVDRRPVSIDVVQSAEQAISLLDSLVLGGMSEAVEDRVAAVPTFRGQPLIRNQRANLEHHRLAIRLAPRASGVEDCYEITALKPLPIRLRVTLDPAGKLLHLLAVHSPHRP